MVSHFFKKAENRVTWIEKTIKGNLVYDAMMLNGTIFLRIVQNANLSWTGSVAIAAHSQSKIDVKIFLEIVAQALPNFIDECKKENPKLDID